MTLNEAEKGSAIIVVNLGKTKPERRNVYRDLGAYEHGLLFIDEIKDGRIFFHKDSSVVSIPLDEAETIEVVPCAVFKSLHDPD